MHYIAPFPIIIGVAVAIVGLLWLIAAGSDEDGGLKELVPGVFIFLAAGCGTAADFDCPPEQVHERYIELRNGAPTSENLDKVDNLIRAYGSSQ
jgi:hypothetical protein